MKISDLHMHVVYDIDDGAHNISENASDIINEKEKHYV